MFNVIKTIQEGKKSIVKNGTNKFKTIQNRMY